MKITIYDIKQRVEATGSHFFDRKSLKFFGQTLKMFSVLNYDNYSIITAPMCRGRGSREIGQTIRRFDHKTNKLTKG